MRKPEHHDLWAEEDRMIVMGVLFACFVLVGGFWAVLAWASDLLGLSDE